VTYRLSHIECFVREEAHFGLSSRWASSFFGVQIVPQVKKTSKRTARLSRPTATVIYWETSNIGGRGELRPVVLPTVLAGIYPVEFGSIQPSPPPAMMTSSRWNLPNCCIFASCLPDG
jgi:hypothetical protein